MARSLVGNIVELSVAWMDNGSVDLISVQGPRCDVALIRCVGPAENLDGQSIYGGITGSCLGPSEA